MFFTTSWDDGYAQDLKVADLLDRYGLKGTFYVCPKVQHGERMLSAEELQKLSKNHDIGAHTLTHPRLTEIPTHELEKEILGSKTWVEERTGKPCTMFCYPKGLQNAEVRSAVKEAGYKGARTCQMFQYSAEDPYALPVSIQCLPFPMRKVWTPAWKLLDPLGPLRAHRKALDTAGVPWNERRSWLRLARFLFQKALKEEQPFFHLYGHSRELEQARMWNDLEAFFKLVSRHHKELTHVTNSELVSALTFPVRP
jgi:peptidoglycan/xylan/chitin deacetylase (PgdA/CDA1 family)